MTDGSSRPSASLGDAEGHPLLFTDNPLKRNTTIDR